MMEEVLALTNEIFELQEVCMTKLFESCVQPYRRTC